MTQARLGYKTYTLGDAGREALRRTLVTQAQPSDVHGGYHGQREKSPLNDDISPPREQARPPGGSKIIWHWKVSSAYSRSWHLTATMDKTRTIARRNGAGTLLPQTLDKRVIRRRWTNTSRARASQAQVSEGLLYLSTELASYCYEGIGRRNRLSPWTIHICRGIRFNPRAIDGAGTLLLRTSTTGCVQPDAKYEADERGMGCTESAEIFFSFLQGTGSYDEQQS